MLGFHADGIRLFGASDTLVAALKKHKLPLVKTSTTNTLVFAVNTAEPLTKKLYLPSFLALGGENTVSLSAAWRYRGGSYGAETALTPDTAKLLGGALDPDKTLELRITATDGFGQSALRTPD